MAFIFGFISGIIVGGLFVLFGDKMLDKYLPEETLRVCPPCDNLCNQGRNCPAAKK